jgi:predicted acetyltransferase
MTRDAIDQRIFRAGLPIELISKMLGALAEATMDLMVLQPAMAKQYRNAGFEVYWAGIAR